MIGKALIGELSCPCDRSCFVNPEKMDSVERVCRVNQLASGHGGHQRKLVAWCLAASNVAGPVCHLSQGV